MESSFRRERLATQAHLEELLLPETTWFCYSFSFGRPVMNKKSTDENDSTRRLKMFQRREALD